MDFYNGFKDIIKTIIPKDILLFRRKILSNKRLQPRTKLYFEVHLTEHCNLACKGCSHFSPIAEKEYLNISGFEMDCERLSRLSDRQIHGVALLGGEPLLHPQIVDVIKIIGKLFDYEFINILTNGTLLLKQTEEFWELCCKNRVSIHVSWYPINIDINAIKAKAEEHNVKIYCPHERTNTMRKDVLDIQGEQDIEDNFKLCFKSNACIQLQNGRLYPCSVVPNIRHFNKYFNCDLKVTKDDYINIYEAKDTAEIACFLSKPIPFCKYCNIKGSILNGMEWEISKRSITEWT
ncbi:MAG: radical SAM protein [Treponema sp.]|jgi:MoaA/NifB/PqqE/SkfB family radical SAM enzyme|nr:radical SAM protein [Treponema sp.]